MIEYDNEMEVADVSCDHCLHCELMDGEFHEIVSQMRTKGWKITHEDHEYKHKCPSCVADEEDLEDFL